MRYFTPFYGYLETPATLPEALAPESPTRALDAALNDEAGEVVIFTRF